MTTTQKQTAGTFKTISWEEDHPPEGHVGPRIAHARTSDQWEGVIAGTSVAAHVMYYTADGVNWGAGTFYGYELITGEVDGRKGSFVLLHVGSFDGTTVRADLSAVEGSGTGDLAGLRGSGSFEATHGEEATAYTFEVE
jgi:hypothetical protein